jgi:hypothetical protein
MELCELQIALQLGAGSAPTVCLLYGVGRLRDAKIMSKKTALGCPACNCSNDVPQIRCENCSYIFSPDLLEAARDLYLAGKQLLKERSKKVYESDGEFQQRWAIAWERLQRAVAKVERVK